MSRVVNRTDAQAHDSVGLVPPPWLEPGDHLHQKEFHRRYLAMPKDVKAELIGGVVFMPAALGRSHGRSHSQLVVWLGYFETATPGVEVYDNVTTILSDDSEPQPDACLIIHPGNGGQMRFTDDDFLEGSPELVAEVASSTESYDLHSKKRDYERARVKEYIVVALRQKQVFWFVNRDGKLQEKTIDADGVFRSGIFPGLWLDPQSLLDLDGRRLLETLQQGIATQEHAQFVERLDAQGHPHTPGGSGSTRPA